MAVPLQMGNQSTSPLLPELGAEVPQRLGAGLSLLGTFGQQPLWPFITSTPQGCGVRGGRVQVGDGQGKGTPASMMAGDQRFLPELLALLW